MSREGMSDKELDDLQGQSRKLACKFINACNEGDGGVNHVVLSAAIGELVTLAAAASLGVSGPAEPEDCEKVGAETAEIMSWTTTFISKQNFRCRKHY